MKRKITLLSLVLVIVIFAIAVLVACNDGVNGVDGVNVRYYKYDDGVKEESSWIEIRGDKWCDSDGLSGIVEIDGERIVFFNNGVEQIRGTIRDGVLSFEGDSIYYTYAKDGAMINAGDNAQVDEKVKVTAIQGGTVEGLRILLDVAPNVIKVDLSDMLTVPKHSSWHLYASKAVQTPILNKVATNLKDGDNLYYVVVNSEDGSINRMYTLSIHKQYYTNIYLKANDTTVKTIEDVLTHTMVELNPPSEMEGYTLTWGANSYYVTENNKVIEASSTTPKTLAVKLNADGGVLNGEATQTLIYDTEYTLPVPSKNGYTFMGWKFNDNFVTDANGSSISNFRFDEIVNFFACWSSNKYTVTTTTNLEGAGTYTTYNEKEFEVDEVIVLTASTNAGYTWLGWYEGRKKVSVDNNLTYMFTMGEESKTYTAR
ncbi:MAG: InlB B-repeat-containing protein, partial [Clostridia bacterium]|nr:InlB B-repeat-containing protein [Clostridia bacterium]